MATNKLGALFDAWDKNTGDGRDAARARQICHDYIKANPQDFAEFDALVGTLSGDELRDHMVGLVDNARDLEEKFREGGMEKEATIAADHKLLLDVWIMSRIDPQQIGGTVEATVRIP